MLASSSRHALKESSASLPRIGPSVQLCAVQQSGNTLARISVRQASTRTSPFAPAHSGPFWARPNTSFREPGRKLDLLASFNMRLSKAVGRKRSAEAFVVCRQMKEAGVQPDFLTYEMLLQTCGTLTLHAEAWAVYEDMVAMGIRPEASTFTHLLNAVHLLPISQTWDVWQEMRDHGVWPDERLYGLLIRRLVNAGNLEMALQYLGEMGDKGIPAALITVTEIINLACQLHFPKLALGLAQSFDSSSIRRLDAQTWMSILIASSEAFDIEGVKAAWEQIVEQNHITPDEGCCINVLHTAGRHGSSQLGMAALTALRGLDVVWEEYHFAPVVEAFSNEGNLREAFGLLTLMRQSGVTPVSETAQPIFHAIAGDVAKVDDAYSLMETMHSEGMVIDPTGFNAVVQACVTLGDLQRALGTYKSASSLGVTPTVDTFNILLTACIAAEHRELGDRLLTEMREAKTKPDAGTYERLVVLCLTQPTYEDAFFYLEDMKGANIVPPQSVYEAIIRRCVSVGDSRYKLAVAEMLEHGYEMPTKLKAFIDNGGKEVEEAQEHGIEGSTRNGNRRRRERAENKNASGDSAETEETKTTGFHVLL